MTNLEHLFEAPVEREGRDLKDTRHLLRLASAMAPDPREWGYAGEYADAGPGSREHCTCGCPIRYVFTIVRERDGATLPIGSVCIEESVPYLVTHGAEHLASRLTRAVEEMKARIAEEKRRIRDAAADEQVTILLTEFDRLVEYARALRREARFPGGWLPEVLYRAPKRPKAASTPGRTAAGLRTRLAALYPALVDAAVSANAAPPLPPTEPKLVERIAADLRKQAEWSRRSAEAAGRAYAPFQTAGESAESAQARADAINAERVERAEAHAAHAVMLEARAVAVERGEVATR